jgi:hypothetical protein
MLEHPNVVQVAGDSITMFYRRWTPAGRGGNAVAWKLEAYSWGGLTEAPLAAAAWILMAPFMFFNLGHFMLPRTKGRRPEQGKDGTQRLSRDRWHTVATALLRLLAVTATVQFTVCVNSILVNTLAYQGKQAHVPAWVRGFTQRSAHARVDWAVAATAAVIAALWWVSVATARRYETRVSAAEPELNAKCPLTQPTFWAGGQELVRRQRSLHAAAACAVTAIIVARPVRSVTGFRAGVLLIAGLILVTVAVSLCLRLADRHEAVLGRKFQPARSSASGRERQPATPATRWCQGVLLAAVIVLAAAMFTGDWQDPATPRPRTVPGLDTVCVVLLLTQAVLLFALLIVVAVCASKVRPAKADPDRDPFLRGQLTTVIATLGVCFGGLMSALASLFVSRLLGAPVPSRAQPAPAPQHALQVPWPMYAFTAEAFGLAVAAIPVAVWLGIRWRRDVNDLLSTNGGQPQSRIGAYYGTEFGDPDSQQFAVSRRRIARAWATGRITDRIPGVALASTFGMVLALALGESALAWWSPSVPRGLVSAESAVGLFLAGALVARLRSAYKNPAERKTVGALWDVATFWPRAAHPFAPPCYAERAIPELVDRVRVLTGTVKKNESDPAWWALEAHRRNADRTLEVATGPLLLTGYSQGSVIAPAVVAQLPKETVGRVALLTLACPARRLYGRAFPAYFGPFELRALASRLAPQPETAEPKRADGTEAPRSWPEFCGKLRWRNLVRETDYIGSWVFEPITDALSETNLQAAVDQPCWDPPAISADRYPTPAQIHFHSDFWQDPRATELGDHLIRMLTGPTQHADKHLPWSKRAMRSMLARDLRRQQWRRQQWRPARRFHHNGATAMPRASLSATGQVEH